MREPESRRSWRAYKMKALALTVCSSGCACCLWWTPGDHRLDLHCKYVTYFTQFFPMHSLNPPPCVFECLALRRRCHLSDITFILVAAASYLHALECFNSQAPSYIKDLIVPDLPNRGQCSQNAGLLVVSWDSKTRTEGGAFSHDPYILVTVLWFSVFYCFGTLGVFFTYFLFNFSVFPVSFLNSPSVSFFFALSQPPTLTCSRFPIRSTFAYTLLHLLYVTSFLLKETF